MKRLAQRAPLALVLAYTALMTVAAHTPRLASAQSGIAFYDLGSQAVSSGTDWTFSADFAISAGAWESVTVTNYGYCFVGPNDPRAGTAHAGGVFWFAELQAQPPQNGGYVFTGSLANGRINSPPGNVTVTTNGDPASPRTHIEATLSRNDPSFFQGENLEVCLLGSS